MHVAFCHFLQVWKRIWILEVWSENGCGKWHFWVWNRVRTLRTGRHIPTKNSQEYPLPLSGRMNRCPHSTSVTQESAEQVKIDVSRATNHDKLSPSLRRSRLLVLQDCHFYWDTQREPLRRRENYIVINHLSPNIHIQILQTDPHTFPNRISWGNLIADQSIFSKVIIS